MEPFFPLFAFGVLGIRFGRLGWNLVWELLQCWFGNRDLAPAFRNEGFGFLTHLGGVDS